MHIHTPSQLMIDQLRDLASVQEQLVEAQSTLVELSRHPGLKDTLRRHHADADNNVITLHTILKSLHAPRTDDTCQAMKGLLSGGEEHLRQVPNHEMRDLMMIAHCLRIEGYEIVAHEFTAYLAGQCGHQPIAQKLKTMLQSHFSMKLELQALQNDIFEATHHTST